MRATTENDKEEIIDRLLQVWLSSPGLRLGQLLGNAIEEDSDLYHINDFDLIEKIEEHYEDA